MFIFGNAFSKYLYQTIIYNLFLSLEVNYFETV